MVIDVTTKTDSTMTIDEFFHQVELGSLQLCYEFELERINLYNLNENSIKTKLADAGFDIVSFFNKLKQKIIDFCKKAVQFLTELLSRGLNNINEIQKSSLLKKYKLDQIKDAIDKVVPNYLKDHPFYDIHALNGIDRSSEADLDTVKKVFKGKDDDDWATNHGNHINRISLSERTPTKSGDKYMENFIIKENEYHLVSEIIMKDDIKKSINSDIDICKKYRDKDLKTMEKLINIDKEHNKDIADKCNEILKIYSTKLKMILSNAKSKIAILILAKKELEKSDKDNTKKRTYENKLTNSFYDAVDSGNVRRVRIMMKDSLLVDPTFKELESMKKYASNMEGLYDKYDGQEFKPESEWSDDYMIKEKVRLVYNFCDERLNLLKKIVTKHVNGELKKSDDKDSDKSKKNEYPLVSDIFKGVVSKGDLIAIRSYLANYLVGEKDFNLFDQAAKYANNYIDNIYVNHDGEKFEIDKSKWNKDILNTQLVNVVNNFSRERISYIKKLIPVVLKRK